MADVKRPFCAADTVALAAMAAWAAGAAYAARHGLWLGLGSTGLVVGVTVLVVALKQVKPLLQVQPLHVVVGVLAGLVMVWATRALYVPVAAWLPFVKPDTVKLYAALGERPERLYGLLIVPIALGEEIVWRGAVQSALMRRFGTSAAVPLSALLYALMHMPVGVPTLTMAAFGCGLVWAALRAKTAGLLAPFFAHLVWDEVMFFVAPLVSP